mgnify:CR=1 FL=1
MKAGIHRANYRYFADYGWLKTWHSFNFADYFNPLRERFGVIRVLNDEVIAPGKGFDMHEYKNLEILLFPLNGELKYQDQSGHESTLSQDEVQIISAGSGITFAFGNNSNSLPLEIIQIWLFPKIKNINPRIQCLQFNERERHGKFQLIASPEVISDVLWINQQTWISEIDLLKGQSASYNIQKANNVIFIFVITGSILFGSNEDMEARQRDSVEITDIDGPWEFIANQDSKLLLVDAPRD